MRVRMGERLRMTAVWRMGRGGFLGWGIGAPAGGTSTSVARPRRKIGLPVKRKQLVRAKRSELQ